MPRLHFMPPISPMNLQFLLHKSLFVNIRQVTESYFSPLFLPPSLSLSLLSLLCCLFLSEPDTSPLVKAVKSVCEYSNPAITKEGFVLLHSG